MRLIDLIPILLFLWSSLFVCSVLTINRGIIEDLRGFPGFKSIKLSWRFIGDPNVLTGFQIQLCEPDSWRRSCHKRQLYTDQSKMIGSDVIISDNNGRYQATLYSLRAATKYNVNVSPMVILSQDNRLDFGNNFRSSYSKQMDNWVIVETRPFSARVANCASNDATITVNTGRFFGGKIGVASLHTEGCYVIGNRNSLNETISLTFNYDLCRAIKVGSSILANITVQENSVVMTGTDRQFVVNCSYAPSSLVVSASVNMPVEDDNEIGANENNLENVIVDDVFTYDKYKGNNFRQSRILADHDALSTGTIYEKIPKFEGGGLSAGHIMVMLFLVLASLTALVASLYWVIRSSKMRQEKATELPDGTDDRKLVLDDTDVATSQGVLPASHNEVSLVSIKSFSEA